MPCGLKFRWRKGKRHHSSKSSRSPSPQPEPKTPVNVELFRPIPRTPPQGRVGPPPSPPVPTNPVAPVAPEPPGPLSLIPCAVCGRTFVPESLPKHVKICEKTAAKRRKTFDSSRQRREGTDLAQFLPKNFGLPENSPFLEKSPPNTAKVVPKPKPQTVRTTVMKPAPDLQKCPHCSRAFGMRAFERHVEWCADKAKILPAAPAQPPQHIADAKQRLNARTQYKAPPVRGRRSSQTRDKSSNSRSASVESSRGVSPPPPRECGDGRRRTRASESMSSNDCHDEPSPHVPVIRNTRNSMNNSTGDANVKARQARLARDLSSSRLDDGYDPFVSAARQMKELLSSDTNIPKKLLNSSSKDLTRTLPILRPAKDKAPLSQLRTENSKMMKDTLNKTYQKTPTLQRMKSFGSTNNDNNTSNFGGRCSSFRLNRNDKKPTPKLNTTFTKSSKENISVADKTNFNRNNSLNRSFSSYSTSSYSTPKPKDKIPKIATSMYHSFQRTTIKQPLKLDKIKADENDKKTFVNLDAILADDNSSMTDSNYIDPRLINENDNLPINVNTILNNPDIISSMESLLTTENLPSKFDSFSKRHNNYESNGNIELQIKAEKEKVNNNTDTNKLITAPVDNLSAQYDKIMSSLEESIASKTLAKDEGSVFEEFDLEEFMTTFDEEILKRRSENKRTCSSTTRVVRQSELVGIGSNRTSAFSSVSSTPKSINPNSNGLAPVTNPKSFNFSSNHIVSDNLFPSSIKRSTSLLDSIQKKNVTKAENEKPRHKSDQLEQDLMRSLKDFDKFYESEKNEINHSNKNTINYNLQHNGLTKMESRDKVQRKSGKSESHSNGNYTPNGKSSNDSAYSSLNRISPSKLTICPKEPNGPSSLERIPAGSDSSGSQKDEIRSISSEEFLAMERSAELDEPLPPPERHTPYKEADSQIHEKRVSSRASSRRSSTWRPHAELSSSSSEVSLHKLAPAPRLSRFCHDCGSKFPDAAKFCIECGVKRLAV